MSKPANLTKTVQVACLSDLKDLEIGRTGYNVGWNVKPDEPASNESADNDYDIDQEDNDTEAIKNSNILQNVKLDILDISACADVAPEMPKDWSNFNLRILKSQSFLITIH